MDIEALLIQAYAFASNSPDPSTQNAALIVDDDGNVEAWACNTFTRGMVVTDEMLVRPLKYTYIEHAERGAVFHAARLGTKCLGKTMVCPWASCAECARSIVQAGIKTLVRHQDASDRSPERWVESIALSDKILEAGHVEIINHVGKLNASPIMHCEELWTP